MARSTTTSDALNAIAKPQLREILVLLWGANLAQDLVLTQPQPSNHLRVRGAGKQRLYDLDARGLRPHGKSGSVGTTSTQ